MPEHSRRRAWHVLRRLLLGLALLELVTRATLVTRLPLGHARTCGIIACAGARDVVRSWWPARRELFLAWLTEWRVVLVWWVGVVRTAV